MEIIFRISLVIVSIINLLPSVLTQPVKAVENEWHCEYHINIDYKNKQGKPIKTVNLGGKKIIGFDMVQAIQSAFLVIDSLITAYNNDNENKIFWLEYGNDCGFIKK